MYVQLPESQAATVYSQALPLGSPTGIAFSVLFVQFPGLHRWVMMRMKYS